MSAQKKPTRVIRELLDAGLMHADVLTVRAGGLRADLRLDAEGGVVVGRDVLLELRFSAATLTPNSTQSLAGDVAPPLPGSNTGGRCGSSASRITRTPTAPAVTTWMPGVRKA